MKLFGFDSGVEQFLGTLKSKSVEYQLTQIAKNAQTLIQEDLEKNPPEPPIKFPPESEEDTEEESKDDVDSVGFEFHSLDVCLCVCFRSTCVLGNEGKVDGMWVAVYKVTEARVR